MRSPGRVLAAAIPASVSQSVDSSGYATHISHTGFGRPCRLDLAAFPGCAIPSGFGHAVRRIPNCGPGFCLNPSRQARHQVRTRTRVVAFVAGRVATKSVRGLASLLRRWPRGCPQQGKRTVRLRPLERVTGAVSARSTSAVGNRVRSSPISACPSVSRSSVTSLLADLRQRLEPETPFSGQTLDEATPCTVEPQSHPQNIF